MDAIRNLLPRKFDPPDTFNERCKDTEPCDTQESVERYVRTHIFCMLETVVFPNKSTTSLNLNFLPLLRNFHRISGYSWGVASLTHLYRSLCRASRYNCKEMDGPLISLFERMSLLAPISRDQLGDVVVYGSVGSECPRCPVGYVLHPIATSVIRLGEEIIDFHPFPVYYEWYTQHYGIHMRLSDRVAGEEVGADEPQQQQEEPAGP
ncbi:hypothetical protein Ahy_A03g014856 [Arachis hypogaea]|uniref:Aminotransferase-like plant mobile domain-containing protein n=1 Tax=Arachis hypogaea TaxID=3818 RepID=A0A445DZ31_ARAHY|nr:hypothetical protein Ahy_A03g014856 [Arachis hypogaea]